MSMLSLQRCFQVRRFGPSSSSFELFLSSRIVRTAIAVVFLITLVASFQHIYTIPEQPSYPSEDAQYTTSGIGKDYNEVAHSNKGRLHLLIPATSSNPDLCKLLLSAQVLNYPTPVLINYGDVEDTEDAYKQHLAKVEGILNYLEQLDTSSEYDEDLVLILDGYDVHLQLRKSY